MESKLVFCFEDDSSEETQTLVQLLKEYQKIICSSIGPLNSSFKIIAPKSDFTNTTVTTSSKWIFNLLYRLESQNGLTKWRFDVIKTSIESSHFAHNFDSGLFLAYLVNQLIILYQRGVNRNFSDLILKSLYEKLQNDKKAIDSSSILVKLDLNNLSFLHSLLKTILFSNKFVSENFDSEEESSNFVNSILKLNLNSFNQCIDDACKYSFSRIIYLFNDDSMYELKDSQIFNGVLIKQDKYYCDYEIEKIASENAGRGFKCVVFDTNSLSGDFENYSDSNFKYETDLSTEFGEMDLQRTHMLLVKKLKNDFDILIDKYKIDMVLSQKVIHPSVKSHLKKIGVIVIDRLSIVYTKPVLEITNCQLYNSAWDINCFNEKFFGYSTSICVKKIFGETYIHIENSKNSNIQTMIVCVPNQSFTKEIEYLLEVAQYSFRRTITNGAAACGGPCFYTSCLCYLWKNLENMLKTSLDTDSIRKPNLVWYSKQLKQLFQNYFIQLLEEDPSEYTIDLDCGHLYHTDELTCVCGLFLSDKNAKSFDLDDDFLLDSIDLASSIFSNPKVNELKRMSSLKLIDCLESKLNSLTVTRDILTTILNVGVFIHD